LAKLDDMKNARFAPHVLALILSAGAVLSTPAQASGQWKWRDASGSIQYSDRPPPQGTPESAILARPRASTARIVSKPVEAASAASGAVNRPSAPTAKSGENELDAKRRKLEEEEKAKQQADEAKQAKDRAENCTRAKAYQRTLNDGIRISRTNSQGEREILDDAGRADEMRRTLDAIKDNCQ
jgi:hypothetical protein